MNEKNPVTQFNNSILLIVLVLLCSCSNYRKTENSERKKALNGIWKYTPRDSEIFNLFYFNNSELKTFNFDGFKEYFIKVDSSIIPYKIDIIDKKDSTLIDRGLIDFNEGKLKLLSGHYFAPNSKRPKHVRSSPISWYTKSDWNELDFNNFKNEYISKKITEISNLNDNNHREKSALYYEINDYKNAIKELELNIKLHGPNPMDYNNIALHYRELRNFELTHMYLDSSLAIKPTECSTLHIKGLTYCMQGNNEMGCKYFEKSAQASNFCNSYLRNLKFSFCEE